MAEAVKRGPGRPRKNEVVEREKKPLGRPPKNKEAEPVRKKDPRGRKSKAEGGIYDPNHVEKNIMKLTATPEETSLYVAKNTEIFALQPVDLTSVEDVSNRIFEYFEICRKYAARPTVAGFAMALGMSRTKLYRLKVGKMAPDGWKAKAIPQEVLRLIRRTYDMMESLWEDYMLNGKINPVSGIFIGKNNFEYKDQQEHVVVQEVEDVVDVDSIRAKYLLDEPTE